MNACAEETADQFSHDAAVARYSGRVDDGFYPHEAVAVDHFGDPPGCLLDLGCGAGRTTKPFADAGFDIVGVDISEEMIRAAVGLVDGASFHVADAADLPFVDGEFDGVLFSYNGLDYIPTEERRLDALREVRRVLTPGGHFVFSTHNARRVAGSNLLHPMSYVRTLQFWWENVRAGTLGSRYKMSRNQRRYQITPGDQHQQLREVGFEPVSTVTQHPHACLLAIDPWPYYVARKPE